MWITRITRISTTALTLVTLVTHKLLLLLNKICIFIYSYLEYIIDLYTIIRNSIINASLLIANTYI